MDRKHITLSRFDYRCIYIIDTRNSWDSCKANYDVKQDLVLTIDFGLKQLLEKEGGEVYYLDHLLASDYVEEQNYKMHFFLNNWFKSESGEDLLALDGVMAGNAFLLNILNDVSNKVHYFFNLLALRQVHHQKIIAVDFDPIVTSWLKQLKLETTIISPAANAEKPIYFFPIGKWMQERMDQKSLKAKLKMALLRVIDYSLLVLDFFWKDKRPAIFVQSYYPTRNVIKRLKADRRVKFVTASYSGLKEIVHERRILYTDKEVDPAIITAAIHRFRAAKKQTWETEEGDLAAYLYPLIEESVFPRLKIAYSRLNDIKKYFSNKQLKLMVPITDYWMENRLLMNYCHSKGIPVFMIINGLLTVNFVWDGRDADFVNSYGDCIKTDYFKGKDNVVCLGDPRMDQYSMMETRIINRETPTIVIGTAGYSILDLNSYVAFEFEFLYDILLALKEMQDNKYRFRVIIKVRGNGYYQQYEQFIKEYFPGLDIDIQWDIPFATLISQADFYISFYSQTVFEASAIGIPALYYRIDTQKSNRPYDGNSELTTAHNVSELKEKIAAFYANDPCYEAFLDKKIMEKYIGPLDGGNTQRNVDYIYNLLK